jgi:large subunit ribosomal protein L6
MSRVAKNPINVPEKVEVGIDGGRISVKGPMGTLMQDFGAQVNVVREGNQINFKAIDGTIKANAMSGTARALVANMVQGVTKGFEKKLALVGVGYRAQASGQTLNLSLGFSHPVVYKLPDGVKAETPTQTDIVVKGIDKQRVGEAAAQIRAYRPPEPYKGKGVRYVGEVVKLKETKKK